MNAFASRARVLSGLLLFAVLVSCKPPAPSSDARPIKFYQSPMHPWITSDKPGNCTICGMALVPVYADSPEARASASTDVTLGESSVRTLGVATAPVRRGELRVARTFSGTFEDNDNLHRVIAAFYDGRIERVYIDHVGQFVRKGEPLAAIYSPELLYVVRELQTASRDGNSGVAATSARRLIQFGLTPGQVNALAKQPEPAYTVDLLAPADGTIVTRQAYQGQYIKTGEPLFETGNLARLWFHAEVYERDLSAIRLGDAATLTSPVAPGRKFPGTITFIDPNFDPASRSTNVRIEVDNPQAPDERGGKRYLLPHRAFGEARIETGIPDRLLVPRSAVLRDGRRSLVYVEKAPGRYEPRAVKTGRSGDEEIEILDGLAEGERVVTTGNLLIDAESQLRAGGSEETRS